MWSCTINVTSFFQLFDFQYSNHPNLKNTTMPTHLLDPWQIDHQILHQSPLDTNLVHRIDIDCATQHGIVHRAQYVGWGILNVPIPQRADHRVPARCAEWHPIPTNASSRSQSQQCSTCLAVVDQLEATWIDRSYFAWRRNENWLDTRNQEASHVSSCAIWRGKEWTASQCGTFMHSPLESWSSAKLTPPLQRLHTPSKRMTGRWSFSKALLANEFQSHPTCWLENAAVFGAERDTFRGRAPRFDAAAVIVADGGM